MQDNLTGRTGKPARKIVAGAAQQKETATPVSGLPAVAATGRCACGGMCPQCRVQGKARADDSADPLEREADQVAAQVMRAPFSGSAAATPAVMAAKAGSGAATSDGFANMLTARQGRGAPLAASTRAFFEPRFGEDFSTVRVHRDAGAAAMAASIGARAFTSGRDLYFADGEFDQHSQAGRRLLAHELTHVVQQRPLSATGNPVQRQVSEETAGEAAAEDADATTLAPAAGAASPPAEEGWSWQRLRDEHAEVAQGIYSLSRDTPQYLEDLEATLSTRGVGIQASAVQQRIIQDYWDFQVRMRRHSLYDPVTVYQWALKLERVVNLTGQLLRLYETRLGGDAGHAFAIDMYRTLRGRLLHRVQRLKDSDYLQQGRELLDTRLAEEAERSRPDPQVAALDELRSLIRDYHRRWGRDLRRHASLLLGPIIAIMDRHIGRESAALVAFFRYVREQSPELLQFLVNDARLIDSAYRERSSPFRVFAIAILGNWTEVLEEDPDSVVAAGHGDEFDEFDESHAEAFSLAEDVIGTLTDTGLGLIPGLDQVLDARDLAADITLIERDIERREFSIMHLVSLVFSLIGTFPELGTLISRGFKVASRTVRRAGYRGLARLANLIERLLPGIFDHLDDMSRVVGELWQGLVSYAMRHWDEVMTALAGVTTRLFESASGRITRLRHYVAEHMPEAFVRAHEMLADFIAALRRRAGDIAETVGETASDLLVRARDRIAGLTATGRLRREFADEAEALQIDALAAIAAGDERLAQRLLARLLHLTDEAEHAAADLLDDAAGAGRRVEGAAAGAAETTEDVTADAAAGARRGAAGAPETPPAHAVPADVLAGERRRLRELAGQDGAVRAVDDPELIRRGYEAEVEVGEGVVYRRRRDGVWCRFNSPADCDVPVPAELEEAFADFRNITDEDIDAFIDGMDSEVGLDNPDEFRPAGGGRIGVAFDDIDHAAMQRIFGLSDAQMSAARELLSGTGFSDDMRRVFDAAARSGELTAARSELSARLLSQLEASVASDSPEDLARELRRLATSMTGDSASFRRGSTSAGLTGAAEDLRARMQRLAFEIELDPARYSGDQLQRRVRSMIGSYRRGLFDDLRDRFYRVIGGDTALLRTLDREEFQAADRLRRSFERAGLHIPTDGGAPFWQLNEWALLGYLRRAGVITDEVDFSAREWRWLERSGFRIPLSIEHITRLTDSPALGLDPMNFMFTLLRENSVLLERIRRRMR